MSPLLLLSNVLFLALALAFLLIILWYDARRAEYQFFALFLLMVIIWNSGSLLHQAAALLPPDTAFDQLTSGILTVGFTGSSASLYALCAVLVGTRLRWFRTVAGLAILVTVLLNLVIAVSQAALGTQTPSELNWPALFFVLFAGAAAVIVWHYRRTIDNRAIVGGVMLFVAGQGIGFLNDDFGFSGVGLVICSFGCLVISAAFVRRELIVPLQSRNQQLLSMHEVSLAITTRITTNSLLNEIAGRAREWLRGDAAAIYLSVGSNLRLEAAHNLPQQLLRLPSAPASLATSVAQTRQPCLIDHYASQWQANDEFTPFMSAFGSVIGTPLIYDNEIVGVLLVVASAQSRVFTMQDLTLLELLASQASVAIAHDQLFGNREALSTQIQLANDQLQTVLASTRSPVLALDRNFVVVFSNAAAYEVLHSLGLNHSVLIVSEILRPLLPRSALIALRDIRRTGVHVYEIQIQDKTYQCRLGTWGSPRVEGWVAVLHDVTELKELDRIKSEMVRMTSHDLKNPLQAALANLDLLKDDISHLPHEREELSLSADNVEKQLLRMQRIISGILDLERARLAVRPTETCDPALLLRKVYDDMGETARQSGIRLSLSIESPVPMVIADAEQLERALINLVENALKFTPAGGQVMLKAHTTGSFVDLQVADNGIGISPEMHERIFERFYRGRQSGIEHISGTGLGLSLVKAVVENHRGLVWVESLPGEGASFTIRLPSNDETVQAIRVV